MITNISDEANEDDNEKSELDKTLQEKLKHELFLDLENFKRSDIFNNLYSRKLKDLIDNYTKLRHKKELSNLFRAMKVISKAKQYIC